MNKSANSLSQTGQCQKKLKCSDIEWHFRYVYIFLHAHKLFALWIYAYSNVLHVSCLLDVTISVYRLVSYGSMQSLH